MAKLGIYGQHIWWTDLLVNSVYQYIGFRLQDSCVTSYLIVKQSFWWSRFIISVMLLKLQNMSIFVSHQMTTHCSMLQLGKFLDWALLMLFSIKSKHQINSNFFPWFFCWWPEHIFAHSPCPLKQYSHRCHNTTLATLPLTSLLTSANVWLRLLTPTGAHWHWVTSGSRRWGELRARCHSDGRCV